MWALLMAIGLLVPALIYFDLFWATLTTLGITLVAGACVFGLENSAHTQRFLTHHGARPGLVWLIKMLIWGIGLVILCARWRSSQYCRSCMHPGRRAKTGSPEPWYHRSISVWPFSAVWPFGAPLPPSPFHSSSPWR